MGTWTHITASFITSLSLVGVSIYYFIEGNVDLGKFFIFLSIYVFISLFYVIRSLFYLKHKATFNEFIYVFILPIVPVLILLAQILFGVNDFGIVTISGFPDESFREINAVDFLLLPYYLYSTFLLFRTFIRYPFIRFRSTSEKGTNPKFAGFLLMLIIPTIYIVTSVTYFENFFLLISGIIYLYSAIMAIFV
jgi:hypothetical protein